MVAFGSTSIAPTVATRAVARAVADVEDEARRFDQRVRSRIHRRRPGVVGAALEHHGAAGLPADRGDDAERRAEPLEHGTLLDVQLEIGIWCPLDALAAHRPRLLGAERDDGERRGRQAVGRLDRGDDAEHAVEPPGGRDAVEVRAGPDTRVAARPEEVARPVPRDLEAGVAHPARSELVRRVLLGRVRGAMLRDRVDRIDPLQCASHPGNGRRTRQPASGRPATATNPTCHDVAPTRTPNKPG